MSLRASRYRDVCRRAPRQTSPARLFKLPAPCSNFPQLELPARRFKFPARLFELQAVVATDGGERLLGELREMLPELPILSQVRYANYRGCEARSDVVGG